MQNLLHSCSGQFEAGHTEILWFTHLAEKPRKDSMDASQSLGGLIRTFVRIPDPIKKRCFLT